MVLGLIPLKREFPWGHLGGLLVEPLGPHGISRTGTGLNSDGTGGAPMVIQKKKKACFVCIFVVRLN